MTVPDPTPDVEELRAAVHAVVAPILDATRAVYGPIPGVREPAWWSAPPPVRLAGVIVLALGWVTFDPQQEIDRRFKEMACDLSGELHREREAIARRRDELGAALRCGDTRRVEAVLDRLSGWEWADEGPVVVE